MHVTLKPHWVTVLYHTKSFIFADTVNHVFTRKMVLLGCNKHEGTFTGHDCCQRSSTEIVWEYLFLVTIMYEFFCNCSSVVQYAEPSYLSSVGLKSFFCEDKLNARYNTKTLMGRSNKIWLYLLGLLLFQWRAILNPFNCSYFKCNQQTNRHMFACIAILGKSFFSLELIVVISCYLSNKRWLSKSSRSVLLQLQYTAILFDLCCLAHAVMYYIQGTNVSCILPQVGYCFYCEVRKNVVSSVPEDILWCWLGNYLGLSVQGRYGLHFNVFCMHLLNVGFHSIFCWNLECQVYLQRTYGYALLSSDLCGLPNKICYSTERLLLPNVAGQKVM